LTPIDPTNLIQQAYARILDAIVDQSLPPGHRIRQGDLAGMLGVSRQPISHALHLLHRQGLVTDSGRKGFEVSRIEPRRIRQLYEVRSVIDGLAARLAAQAAARDRAGRAAMQQALQAGCDADDSSSLTELIARDVEFHRAIYRLADNPAIEEMVAPHWPHMRRSMAAVLTELDYRDRAWREHGIIAARIVAGDADGAEEAARAHAIMAGRFTEESLARASRAA
jgi:DNA-binding GntR family transcriptional regulator